MLNSLAASAAVLSPFRTMLREMPLRAPLPVPIVYVALKLRLRDHGPSARPGIFREAMLPRSAQSARRRHVTQRTAAAATLQSC
jgi:hypothetical protein